MPRDPSTTQKGSTMVTRKRTATFAVIVAATIVPSLGAQAAIARPSIEPLELCHPKWVVGPHAAQTQSMPSIDDLDVEHGTASGEPDPLAYETVDYDDLTYDGC
jgi:hypothetical protein